MIKTSFIIVLLKDEIETEVTMSPYSMYYCTLTNL